jgi:hypothetical protein
MRENNETIELRNRLQRGEKPEFIAIKLGKSVEEIYAMIHNNS